MLCRCSCHAAFDCGDDLWSELGGGDDVVDRSDGLGSLDVVDGFEFGGDFAALPVGSAGITHQKFERRFPRLKRIVLLQIPDAQCRMPDDFAAIELFLFQQDAAQSRFPGSVPTDEADFFVRLERQLRVIENRLRTKRFTGLWTLQQNRHGI